MVTEVTGTAEDICTKLLKAGTVKTLEGSVGSSVTTIYTTPSGYVAYVINVSGGAAGYIKVYKSSDDNDYMTLFYGNNYMGIVAPFPIKVPYGYYIAAYNCRYHIVLVEVPTDKDPIG